MKKNHLLAIDHLDVGWHALYVLCQMCLWRVMVVAASTPMAPAPSWGLDWPGPGLGRTEEPVPGQPPAVRGSGARMWLG